MQKNPQGHCRYNYNDSWQHKWCKMTLKWLRLHTFWKILQMVPHSLNFGPNLPSLTFSRVNWHTCWDKMGNWFDCSLHSVIHLVKATPPSMSSLFTLLLHCVSLTWGALSCKTFLTVVIPLEVRAFSFVSFLFKESNWVLSAPQITTMLMQFLPQRS